MRSIELILLAASLFASSGVPGLFGGRRSAWGEYVAVIMIIIGAVAGITAVLAADDGAFLARTWGLPWGRFAVALDPLSRAFLFPVLIVPALGAIYGLGYWKQSHHRDNGRKLRLFYGVIAGAMTIVVVAQDGVLFLLAWELMAIAAFFLITTDDRAPAALGAGWVYFVASHASTLTLVAMFTLMHGATGSFSLVGVDAARLGPSISGALFILAAIGFGLKAGLVPLHVWLPGAHASAPSHVSAVLSGVMLKMGIYGLVRMTGLLPDPSPWWGAILLAAGAITAVAGLVFAIAQHDLKRLLAYSSIENIGVITIGIGLALLGRSAGQPAWTVLGLGAAVLHVWNHSLFKPLLFLGAGSVLHGTGTRRIDELGGLARRMPATANLFLIGAVAICALPPLSGFVSELLLYLGLFQTLGADGGTAWHAAAAAAAAIPMLALAGGLAVIAFTKLFGVVFLGQPRTERALRAHESPLTMLLPMSALAALCLVLGIFPAITAPLLDRVIATWSTGSVAPPVLNVAPLGWISVASLAILAPSIVAFVLLRRAMRTGSAPRGGTWDCGYAAPTARMQYTGSSYARLAASLFDWALRPRTQRTDARGYFPGTAQLESETPDTVLDRMVLPATRRIAHVLGWARLLQHGRIQLYILYVLATVIVLFVSAYVL